MSLPWKKSKSKSSRISRFVSDLQQSPKHAGSLVVETGFPTSLIDLFVKNRDRLTKPSSKAKTQIAPNPPRRRVSSPPPQKLDPASVTEDPSVSKIDASFVGGLTKEHMHDGEEDGGRGWCVSVIVVLKVFVVVMLALSTKKLAVGITLSAFVLLSLEFVAARVFTLLKLSPEVQIRLDSLIVVGKLKEPSVSFEIIEESSDEIRAPKSNWEDSSTLEKREVQTIRDVVFKNEKSKRSKLKSQIAKKLRSYKKKKKMEIKQKEEEEEVESVTEVSISERDDVSSNPPLLESSEEIEEEVGSKGDLTKAIILIVIVLTGLLNGKVLAAGLTLSWCLIPTLLCFKSQTSL